MNPIASSAHHLGFADARSGFPANRIARLGIRIGTGTSRLVGFQSGRGSARREECLIVLDHVAPACAAQEENTNRDRYSKSYKKEVENDSS